MDPRTYDKESVGGETNSPSSKEIGGIMVGQVADSEAGVAVVGLF